MRRTILLLSISLFVLAGCLSEEVAPTEAYVEVTSTPERTSAVTQVEVTSSVFSETVTCVSEETSFSLAVTVINNDGEDRRSNVYRILAVTEGESSENVLLEEMTFGVQYILQPDTFLIIPLIDVIETEPFKLIGVLEYEGRDSQGNFCFVIPDASPLIDGDQRA